MPKRSAGLLLYRGAGVGVEVLIAHPGGPFWARKDDGAWSIPKGEYGDDEDPWHAAQREFAEELGRPAPAGPRTELGEVRQSGGKTVTAFAVRTDFDSDFDMNFDTADFAGSTVEMEWPRGSGRKLEFPEVDRVEWVPVAVARTKLLTAQAQFLDRLLAHL